MTITQTPGSVGVVGTTTGPGLTFERGECPECLYPSMRITDRGFVWNHDEMRIIGFDRHRGELVWRRTTRRCGGSGERPVRLFVERTGR